MANIEVQVRGLAELARRTPDRLLQPVLRELLTHAALYAERAAREGAPKDTANLARSIAHEVRPELARVYSPLLYARVMELGRRPGARMPPPAALRGWARRHGMAGLEFVLARSIARRGIRGRFYMRKAAEGLARAELPRLIERARRRLEELWRSLG